MQAYLDILAVRRRITFINRFLFWTASCLFTKVSFICVNVLTGSFHVIVLLCSALTMAQRRQRRSSMESHFGRPVWSAIERLCLGPMEVGGTGVSFETRQHSSLLSLLVLKAVIIGGSPAAASTFFNFHMRSSLFSYSRVTLTLRLMMVIL
jgi:hypothetical protein